MSAPLEPPPAAPRTAAERVKALEARLGVTFASTAQALAALTHKSYCNEHRDDAGPHNERLEFLGDAVVNLAVGQRLMERYPLAPEGDLSKMRALMVNEEWLVGVARALGLGELLLLGRGEELTGGRDKSSVLADALEAVAAALYLEGGMPGVLAFVDRFFAAGLDGAASGTLWRDWKSELQVEVQAALKLSPRYRVVGEVGPEHEKIFEVEVSVGPEVFASASGRAKREAEQAAAKAALAMLREKQARGEIPST